MIPLNPTDMAQDWEFKLPSTLSIKTYRSVNHITIDEGSFKADGGLFNSYVTIYGFKQDYEIINGTWKIMNINDHELVMNRDYQNCGGQKGCGVLDKEFTKQ